MKLARERTARSLVQSRLGLTHGLGAASWLMSLCKIRTGRVEGSSYRHCSALHQPTSPCLHSITPEMSDIYSHAHLGMGISYTL